MPNARGIRVESKNRDKPITSLSQRNKPESSSDRKPVLKKHIAIQVPRRKSGREEEIRSNLPLAIPFLGPTTF